MARILWRDAQGVEGLVDLSAGEIKIGRATDCEIRTDDAMVSRYHARLFWGGGGYVLEDLSSANGIFYQETRVTSHLFKHGDALRCGSLWLRFVDLGEQSAPPPGMPGRQPPPVVPPPRLTGGQSAGRPQPAAPLRIPRQSGSISVAPPVFGQPTTDAMSESLGIGRPPATAPGNSAEADVEIRVLRRRIEQLQTELRVYRTNKFSADTGRRMEDLESDLSMLEIERDQLRVKLQRAEDTLSAEAGSLKVKRAIEIAAMTTETAASLHDLLSSLRIEVMAAEGEFEQYAQDLPRSSFELIRQSLREAAGHCDSAREQLRKLREIAD
ncbi:MAG: FHA domain-containing protein [Kofleriaceae bacterium]|nr:FHA domain-containing protein [Kofleriaceae bacterium]